MMDLTDFIEHAVGKTGLSQGLAAVLTDISVYFRVIYIDMFIAEL